MRARSLNVRPVDSCVRSQRSARTPSLLSAVRGHQRAARTRRRTGPAPHVASRTSRVARNASRVAPRRRMLAARWTSHHLRGRVCAARPTTPRSRGAPCAVSTARSRRRRRLPQKGTSLTKRSNHVLATGCALAVSSTLRAGPSASGAVYRAALPLQRAVACRPCRVLNPATGYARVVSLTLRRAPNASGARCPSPARPRAPRRAPRSPRSDVSGTATGSARHAAPLTSRRGCHATNVSHRRLRTPRTPQSATHWRCPSASVAALWPRTRHWARPLARVTGRAVVAPSTSPRGPCASGATPRSPPTSIHKAAQGAAVVMPPPLQQRVPSL
eukprot:PhM_4_TR8043/c0_g1_i1/m.106621